MEAALCSVDEGGRFKASALEAAFTELENKHRGRFSNSADQSSEQWAQSAREAMRSSLARTNKAKLQQKKRDDTKAKEEEPGEPPARGAVKASACEETPRKRKLEMSQRASQMWKRSRPTSSQGIKDL